MTGYDRCITVIEGGCPDRIPAYTPTIASDVASRILGRPAHTGGPALWYAEAVAWCRGPSAWREFDAQVIDDTIALARAVRQDVVRLPWRHNIQPTRQLDETTFLCGDPDGEHQIWCWDPGSMNFLATRKAAGRAPESWPARAREMEAHLDDYIAAARANAGVSAAALQQRVGDAMLVPAGAAGLSLGVGEDDLLATILEPGAVAAILDVYLAIGLAELEAIAARGLKVILGGGDMADKNGPLYSPTLFRELMLPRWTTIAERSRELGLHYVWRSDGNLWKVTDMLFSEAGFPGFGEVDFDATMTLAAVRARYPDLVLWANASGDILRRGDAETVRRHCRDILTAADGRGYVHGCSNTILPGTPPDSVWAMMQALEDREER